MTQARVPVCQFVVIHEYYVTQRRRERVQSVSQIPFQRHSSRRGAEGRAPPADSRRRDGGHIASLGV